MSIDLIARGMAARALNALARMANPELSLGALTLSASGVPENSAPGTVVGAVQNAQTGSTVALLNQTTAGEFALAGGYLVAGATNIDFEAGATRTITLRETNADAINSPRDTTITITIVNSFEKGNVGTLSLSNSAFVLGVPSSGTVNGASTGSAIAGANLPAGLTINGPARTFAYDGAGAIGNSTITLTETLADSANSPKANAIGVSIVSASLQVYRRAIANAYNNVAGPVIINAYGDSTFAGSGGGVPAGQAASTQGNNARAGGIVPQLGDKYASVMGLARNGADLFGSNLPTDMVPTSADLIAWNNSITSVGSWFRTNNSNLISLGGVMLQATSGGGDLEWNAEGRPFNRFVFYYPANGSLGQLKVLIDDVEVGTIDETQGSGPQKVVYTVPRGVHTVKLRWVAGNVVFSGMETIDTTAKKSVHIRNLAYGGATSEVLVGTNLPWYPILAYAALEPASLHIIEGGQINDWVTGVPASTTVANFTTMLNALAPLGGDVLLIGATRSNPGNGATLAAQDATVAGIASLATGNTRAFLDFKPSVGDYTAMNNAGRMNDPLHPNYPGYGAEADATFGGLHNA